MGAKVNLLAARGILKAELQFHKVRLASLKVNYHVLLIV